MGSATQVMLTTRFRATVGQKPTRHPGGQQQPWSFQSHVQRADQHGTRKMAILVMANRIICVKIVNASLAPALQTASLLPINLVTEENFPLGLPNCFPSLFLRAKASLVREEIIERSLSAESEKANAKTLEEMLLPSS